MMKIHTIEVAAAIEEELQKFLREWGGGYPMKFTRFIDLGGKQTDLHLYSAQKDASPWMIARIKEVMRSEEGECIQIFVNIAGKSPGMEEVMVAPEVWKLPALADRILAFAKSDMLLKIGEGAGEIEGGQQAPSLGSASSSDQEDEDYENLDTSGVLAGDGDSGGSDFNPEDVIAQANAGGEDEVADPSDLIQQLNEQEDEQEEDRQ